MAKTVRIAFWAFCVAVSVLMACEAGALEENNGVNYGSVITTAREKVWKAVSSGQGSGGSVAVMDRGKIIYSEGIGVADRSENRQVDTHTRFNIGSVSKMFAAVAVLLLVDEGKVGLDEPVTKYIPEFEMKDKRYQDITVRMLFNHSSGIPGTSGYTGYKADSRMHQILLDTLKDEHLKHAPGAMSIYCNDGFDLAEIIVERVSGNRYLDFLAERVFIPLDMKDTSASIGEVSETNVAEYYDPKTGKKYPRETLTVYGAGGLSSTAEDLCRFGGSFSSEGKRILSEASIIEILKAQPTPFSNKLRGAQLMGAFGWEYSDISDYQAKGIQVLGKGGNTSCYSANLQIVPQERIAVALCISGQAAGEELTRPILDALMEARKIKEPKAKTVKRPVEPQPIPDEELKYAGYYTNDAFAVKITFDKKKEELVISAMPGKKTGKEKSMLPLVFHHNGSYFSNDEHDINCYFTTVDGKDFMVRHSAPSFGVDMLFFQRLEAIDKPVMLKENMDGKLWLCRNVPPYIQTSDPLIVVSNVYDALPGYIEFGSIKKIESADFAGIAATAFRDQTGLGVFKNNGETWAKSGILLFSAADGIRTIVNGVNSIKIGQDGYNKWLKVEKGVSLHFEMPEGGRVMVETPDNVLFDSIVDSDEVYAPAGSYVFCAANPGDEFKIHAR
jgi:CubicO group peptidase (beta-lactamase class C family)